MREWARAGEILAREPGVAMVIGSSSAGKTTLATFLVNLCREAGRVAAIVDSDTGQSDIGPPGVIGMSVVDGSLGRMRDARLTAAYYVGSTSPEGHVHYIIAGTRKMVDRALSAGAEVVLVDTTGLVQGWFGRHLKQCKFDALSPRYVIGIQRSGELEHLLETFERCGGASILRLPASVKARARSREERREFRERAYQRYLFPEVCRTVPFGRVAFLRTLLGSGRPVDRAGVKEIEGLLGMPVTYAEQVAGGLYVVGRWNEPPDAGRLLDMTREAHFVAEGSFQDLLVGLVDRAGEFLAEGILRGIDFQSSQAVIGSALGDEAFDAVRGVVLGVLKIGADGREMGRISPGDL